MAPLHTKFYSSTVISWDFNGEVPVLALEELTLFTSKQDAFITQECVKMFILNHDTNQKPGQRTKQCLGLMARAAHAISLTFRYAV